MPQGNVYMTHYSMSESLPGDTFGQMPWYEDGAQMYEDGLFSSMNADIITPLEMFPYAATPTAMGKDSSVFNNLRLQEWRDKPVRHWSSEDVMNWIGEVAVEEKVDLELISDLERLRVDGDVLWNLPEKVFEDLHPLVGRVLYNCLEKLKQEELRQRGYDVKPNLNIIHGNLPPFHIIKEGENTYQRLESVKIKLQPMSDSEESADSIDRPEKIVKRRPGRPPGGRSKRKPEKKCGRLWEFIRNLLHDEKYCPSFICWENHDEGVFRFVRSDKVAELWGTIKENPKMTYEKLSRAMRYYYKSKVLQPVIGRRLVYKFGPTAKNWRSDNPNFRLPPAN